MSYSQIIFFKVKLYKIFSGKNKRERITNRLQVQLFTILFFIFNFLLLFNYSCVPFLPIPPLQPSGTPLPPPPPPSPLIWSMCPLKTLFIFKERGGEGERVRETSPLTRPLLGTWPTTQACALTGNQTGDLLVLRPTVNPLSHTSQGTA